MEAVPAGACDSGTVIYRVPAEFMIMKWKCEIAITMKIRILFGAGSFLLPYIMLKCQIFGIRPANNIASFTGDF